MDHPLVMEAYPNPHRKGLPDLIRGIVGKDTSRMPLTQLIDLIQREVPSENQERWVKSPPQRKG